MLDSGNMDNDMVEENKYGLMVPNTMAIGAMTWLMEEAD